MDTVAYIDGLHYDVLKAIPPRWLNIESLAQALTPKAFTLTKVRYFTANVKPNRIQPNAYTDQRAYLTAIEAGRSLTQITKGRNVPKAVFTENPF